MRRVVVVSGPPGAGKTTVAVPLARSLGLPLLGKDVLKETLFDAIGHVDPDPLVSSRRLGVAAMQLLWRLAEDAPGVVLEANFRSASTTERARLLGLSPRPIEVHCRVPVEVALARYTSRSSRADHHPVHPVELRRSVVEACLHPFGIGPVIVVDTTRPVEVDRLAQQVRRLLEPGR